MKLGERLRLIRQDHGLTLRDLNERAGLSVPYLSGLERGIVNPSIETLHKIAKAYQITVRDLFTGVQEAGEPKHGIYPEGFLEFLEDPDYADELDADWKDLLLRIDLRGKRPSSKREWVELYLNLRRIFPQRSVRMRLSANDMRTHVIELVPEHR